MFLMVGPCGGGKSTLIRQLQTGQSMSQLNVTLPTVGSNITDLHFDKTKKPMATVRELGGCMSPLWPVYYTNDLKGIIYVIDASDVTQTACSAVLLIELLEHPQLQGTKVLVVFAKADLASPAEVAEYRVLLRLDELRQLSVQQLTEAVVSCQSGRGVAEVAAWIRACAA